MSGGGVTLPPLPAPTGVLTDVEPIPYGSMADERQFEVTMHACTQVAPGRWHWDGYPTVPLEVSSDPVLYEAPAGTVEALGVGAVMSDASDGRRDIAWNVFDGYRYDVATVWLPGDVRTITTVTGRDPSEETQDRCRPLRVDVGESTLFQFAAGCGEPPAGAEPVEGAPGFRWVDGSEIAAVHADGDGYVHVFAPRRNAMTALLGSLQQVPAAR